MNPSEYETCLWRCGAREQVVTLLLQSRANVDPTAKLRGKHMTAAQIAAHKGFQELEQSIQAKRSDAERGDAHAPSQLLHLSEVEFEWVLR